MQQMMRVHDVPTSPIAGDVWRKPKPSVQKRARLFAAECALRTLGFERAARDFRGSRMDHILPFEFDGMEWVRPDGAGREFISACGCWSGFGISPRRVAEQIGEKVRESMRGIIDERIARFSRNSPSNG